MRKLITTLCALTMTLGFAAPSFARTAEEIAATNAWTDVLNARAVTAQALRNRNTSERPEWYVVTPDGRVVPVGEVLQVAPADRDAKTNALPVIPGLK